MGETVIGRTNRIQCKLLCCLHVVVMMAVQVFCIFALVSGLSTVFGKSVTFLNLVDLLFGVFYVSGNWYVGFFSTCVGAGFLFVFVVIIKIAISSIPYIKRIIARGAAEDSEIKDAMLSLGEKTGNSCVYVISFVMACNFVEDSPFLPNTYILMGLWVAVVLLTRVIYSIFDRYTAISVITKFCYDLISVGAIAVFVLFSKYAAIDLLVYAVKGMGVNLLWSVANLIIPVIYFVITIVALMMMHNATWPVDIRNDEFVACSRKILIGSVLLGGAAIRIYILRGYPSKLDYVRIIQLIKPYFSHIFLAAAICICAYFPEEFGRIPEAEMVTDECAVGE